jgi:hypothetical protein
VNLKYLLLQLPCGVRFPRRLRFIVNLSRGNDARVEATHVDNSQDAATTTSLGQVPQPDPVIVIPGTGGGSDCGRTVDLTELELRHLPRREARLDSTLSPTGH